MNTAARPDRYNRASIALHWLMLLLLVAIYAAIELREFFPKGSDTREAFKSWHFMLGLAAFVLVWIRIILRLALPAPAGGGAPSPWQRLLADATHLALYVFMIGMPVAGWLILSADGKPIPFFGIELQPLTGRNERLAEQVEELHELGGTIGYWLIGLHAAAALFHHYLLRDGTLARMLPARA